MITLWGCNFRMGGLAYDNFRRSRRRFIGI